GRDNLPQYLTEEAEKRLAEIALGEGRTFLEPDFGFRSVADWARLKFQIKIAPESLADKEPEEIKALLHEQLMQLYRQKEIEFPVRVAMARFMAEKAPQVPGGQRYDREGLWRWVRQRFPGKADALSEEEFRTQPRSRI